MRYCPACGAPVETGESVCAHCGSRLPREKKRPGGTDRGLKLAITAVAALWLLTAGLWMLWPRLSQAAPAPKTGSGALGGGLSQPAAVSTEPSPAPAPDDSPAPTSTPTAAPTSAPTPDAAPSPSPLPQSSPSPAPAKTVEKLELFSWWWGYLFLNDFQGENPVGKDVVQVWGYIGYTTDDRAFFEIYDVREVQEDTVPLISYYIELHDDYLVPVIGAKDAWVLDRYLDQSDVEPLTLYLRDGSMKLNYHYVYEGASCDLFCMLVPDS